MAFTDREERIVQAALLQAGTIIEWVIQRMEGLTEDDNKAAVAMLKELRETVGTIRITHPRAKKETTP